MVFFMRRASLAKYGVYGCGQIMTAIRVSTDIDTSYLAGYESC